ncbi:hypothetical protein CCR94_05070 [Rhodoblastus sphagnicola]|uniref:Glycosyltransferase subfamily 4-like N-terminal domain-containing protein n=1 Tax=Rhodoblastus sphagnicola TaxID=333368 RepID=A0A2S6ND81_9HYPH|nr:glycosyltransferase family 4 protein [Rhodoblastus sphagnicola]MBB4198011.1 glycosyltransferase involved in cell wall biosynthesis [Rhodoblastus sphagnicola]PPQ32554.1 hypothetical protein CCR94_05070 [Rhodoblastus sphagnicola]
MIGAPLESGRGSAALDLLIVLPSTSFGGAEKHTQDLCEAFAAAGMRVSLLSTAECLDHPAWRDAAQGTMSGKIGAKIGAPIEWRDTDTFEANVARQKTCIEQVLRARRADCAIVCAPWPHYALGLQEALAEHGVPHLTVAHLFPRPGTQAWSELPVMLGFGGGAQESHSAWVGVSWPVARRIEHMFQLPPHSATHIANGVDVVPLAPDERRRRQADARARLGLEPDRNIVLVLGRLDAAKGADLLPDLAEGLADLDALVVVAGAGALRAALETSPAAQAGVLRLVGHANNVSDWLFAADALLMPSRLEGHPLVFLEAAARRCPVVATDAALECYGQAKHQLALVAPTDDVAALTAQTRLALTDRNAGAARVDHAFATVRRDDKAAMISAYKSLLRRLIARELLRARNPAAPASEARHGG